MQPEAMIGLLIVFGAVAWMTYLVGRTTGWESGYEDARVRTTESWELSCVDRGVARYEQYLRRDGAHTRFVWNDKDDDEE
jgi:hypothetical protein